MKRKNFYQMLKRLKYYAIIWAMISKNSFLIMMSRKLLFGMFLFGKVVRFLLFFAFLFFLVSGSKEIAGYNTQQAIFFYLTFNVIDVIAQFLFREVYRFRPLLVSGDFDLILSKPISALFRVLLGGTDVIDLVTMPPLFFAVWYVGNMLAPTPLHVLYYILLLVNGLFIATAFHIAVLSVGIITLEIDHTIMVYRDLTALGTFPVDIYREPIRSVITYLVPVGIMVTLPAKAFFGLVSPLGVFSSFVFGCLLVLLSLRFWDFAIKKYTSASS